MTTMKLLPDDADASVPGPTDIQEMKRYIQAAKDATAAEKYRDSLAARLRARGIGAPDPTERPWDDRLNRLIDLVVEPPTELLADLLHPTGHTILFGHGDVGKGTISAWLAKRLVQEYGHRVLIVDFEDHPEEWKPRIHALGGLPASSDNIQYYEPAPIPIWEQADNIAAAAQSMGATFLIIDSVVFACIGTDTSGGDTSAATHYAGALKTIGLPGLSTAHIPKDSKEPKFPFGSTFWHNAARVTWRVEAHLTDHVEKGVPSMTVLLTCCKRNNGPKPSRLILEIVYTDGQNGLPIDVSVSKYGENQADRITEILENELGKPSTTNEIAKAYNELAEENGGKQIPKDQIRRILVRYERATPRVPARFMHQPDDTWTTPRWLSEQETPS